MLHVLETVQSTEDGINGFDRFLGTSEEDGQLTSHGTASTLSTLDANDTYARFRTAFEQRELQSTERGCNLACWASSSVQELLQKVAVRDIECLTLTIDGLGILCSTTDNLCLFANCVPPYALTQRSAEHGRIANIALGSGNRHYVRFTSGTQSIQGPVALRRETEGRAVRHVSFGMGLDSFVILYEDRSVYCSDISSELEEILTSSSQEQLVIDWISLGPRHQFFVRFRNGTFKFGNLSMHERHFVHECLVLEQGQSIQCCFSEHGMLVRYNRDRFGTRTNSTSANKISDSLTFFKPDQAMSSNRERNGEQSNT